MPAARSGLTGKRGIGGDMGNLEGEGGDMPLGLSVSFANLTVGWCSTAACRIVRALVLCLSSMKCMRMRCACNVNGVVEALPCELWRKQT